MAEERVRAGVGRVVQHSVKRGRVDRAPLHVSTDTSRELQSVLAEVLDDLAERSELRIEVEDAENRFLHRAIRVLSPLSTPSANISDRGRAHGLALTGPGESGGHESPRAHSIVKGTEESFNFEAETSHDVI